MTTETRHGEDFVPLSAAIFTYLSYGVLIVMGHFRDFCGRWLRFFGILGRAPYAVTTEPGYAELLADFDSFYTRRLYTRIRDCWNRPVGSAPGAQITVLERVSKDYNQTFELTGRSIRCLNLGSYNYLGFGENSGPCIEAVRETIGKFGVCACSPAAEAGRTRVQVELEELVARFVGKPAAIVFGMGFATNSTTIPTLVDKHSLIISDALNHSSIVSGCRASGAKVIAFKHNDPADLEAVLRKQIAEGQPRTHRAWSKILIIVEGIYSMEGEICKLPEIVALKKKYRAYLYVDEAHSIGAMGRRGRGVCEYTGVNPDDVDILMGTFTKSFGGVGGYIASSVELINYLRATDLGHLYGTSLSPAVATMVTTTMRIILGEDGTDDGKRRLAQLRDNSNYFRRSLIDMGFVVLGDNDSPIVPLMLYHPAKIPAFSRLALERGLAVVVVGYPATPIILSRTRFCVSAAHTREDIDRALEAISEIGDIMRLKYLA
eukprot:Amastigsp_a175585_179.p1 type:complete len:490 gc:universal Amastigsp_a175585_179:32-1501(+)